MIIYQAKNKITGKIYIGQTKHKLRVRKLQHRRESRRGKSWLSPFHKALLKFGLSKFKFSILARNLSNQDANEMEKLFIKKFNSCNRKFGYNVRQGGMCGGKGALGFKHSEETKRRMSLAKLGNKFAKGTRWTEERRQKIRELHLGKPKSAEHRAKVSLALKNRWRTRRDFMLRVVLKNLRKSWVFKK